MKLILASTSPRRKKLLSMLQIYFEVVAPNFVETTTTLTPAAEVLEFAKQKALSLKNNYKNALIIGCDTLIECEGNKIGKPADHADAIKILQTLAGKTHQVHTGLSIINTQQDIMDELLVTSNITFKNLSSEAIENYLKLDQPYDKAGAYAIQDNGKQLIAQFDGDLLATIGLPLKQLAKILKAHKFNFNEGFLNHLSGSGFDKFRPDTLGAS